MNPLVGIFFTIGSLAFAGAYPFLIRQPRVQDVMRSLIPQRFLPRDGGGFASVSPEEQRQLAPEDLFSRQVVEAAGFVTIVALCLWLLGDGEGAANQLPTPVAALIGIGLGILLRKWWRLSERLSEVQGCASRLFTLGMDGSWQGDSENPLAFKRHLLSSVGASDRGLDVITPSGLSILSLMSHPARPHYEAPHPALAGKRLRILVLPPRSQKVDPQRSRRSCAEEALSRAGTTPEKHWRRLQQALEVQRRWNSEYDCQVEVKFLEGRPIHAMLLAGARGWFRPWFAPKDQWFEVSGRKSGVDFRTALEDQFEGSWQDASQELSVFLRKDGSAAVMTADAQPTH